jgi:hypothetical protein
MVIVAKSVDIPKVLYRDVPLSLTGKPPFLSTFGVLKHSCGFWMSQNGLRFAPVRDRPSTVFGHEKSMSYNDTYRKWKDKND